MLEAILICPGMSLAFFGVDAKRLKNREELALDMPKS